MRKISSKIDRLNKQIQRAKKFAEHSGGALAQLYLIHAAICEEKREALRQKPLGRRRST